MVWGGGGGPVAPLVSATVFGSPATG